MRFSNLDFPQIDIDGCSASRRSSSDRQKFDLHAGHWSLNQVNVSILLINWSSDAFVPPPATFSSFTPLNRRPHPNAAFAEPPASARSPNTRSRSSSSPFLISHRFQRRWRTIRPRPPQRHGRGAVFVLVTRPNIITSELISCYGAFRYCRSFERA